MELAYTYWEADDGWFAQSACDRREICLPTSDLVFLKK
jgi:hypothetical protein